MSEEIPQEIVEAAARAAWNSLHPAWDDPYGPSNFERARTLETTRAALAAARPMMVEAERDAIMDIVKAKAVAVKERISALLHNDEYEEADALGRHLRSLEDIFSEIRARKDTP